MWGASRKCYDFSLFCQFYSKRPLVCIWRVPCVVQKTEAPKIFRPSIEKRQHSVLPHFEPPLPLLAWCVPSVCSVQLRSVLSCSQRYRFAAAAQVATSARDVQVGSLYISQSMTSAAAAVSASWRSELRRRSWHALHDAHQRVVLFLTP